MNVKGTDEGERTREDWKGKRVEEGEEIENRVDFILAEGLSEGEDVIAGGGIARDGIADQ